MLTPRASTSWSWGGLSVVAGSGVGVAAAWVGAWALLGGVALAGVALAARFPMRSEWTVAAFWVAYTAYETVFSTVTIEGFFYAFYLLLGAGVVVGLAGEGLRLPAPYLWLQVSFLFVVLLSFVGFADPIGFDVLVRVIAYLFLPLTLAQVRSPAGVSLVRRAAVVAVVRLQLNNAQAGQKLVIKSPAIVFQFAKLPARLPLTELSLTTSFGHSTAALLLVTTKLTMRY